MAVMASSSKPSRRPTRQTRFSSISRIAPSAEATAKASVRARRRSSSPRPIISRISDTSLISSSRTCARLTRCVASRADRQKCACAAASRRRRSASLKRPSTRATLTSSVAAPRCAGSGQSPCRADRKPKKIAADLSRRTKDMTEPEAGVRVESIIPVIWCAMVSMKASFGPFFGQKLAPCADQPANRRRSCGPQMAKEGMHLIAQTLSLAGEFARGRAQFIGLGIGLTGRLGHLGDAGGNALRTSGCRRYRAGDFGGCGALLLDGGGDGRRDPRDLPDRFRDALDRIHDIDGSALHRGNLRADVLGRLRGLGSEILHLLCHHGKPLAGFASASGLDGGVEGEQIGLGGDLVDQSDNLADAAGGFAESLDLAGYAAGFLDGAARDLGGLRDLLADLADGGAELFGGGGDGIDVGAGPLRGLAGLAPALGGAARKGDHAIGIALDLRCGAAQGLDDRRNR